MSSRMTEQEALAMRGTEFTFVFSDGDTMRAYVKQVDFKRGLSCWSFSNSTDRDKYKFPFSTEEEVKEQAVCLIGVDITKNTERHNLQSMLDVLEEIRDTGRRQSTYNLLGSFTGCPL